MLVLGVLLLLPVALRVHQRARDQHQETGGLYIQMHVSDAKSSQDVVRRPGTLKQD